MKRDWTFQSPHGKLLISASSFPSESGQRLASLHLSSDGYGSWSVNEAARPLASVLDALPDAGFAVNRLSFMGIRLEEKDALQRVAVQAALSKQWRSALKTKSPAQTHPLVVEFINQSGAYEEWNKAFNQKGLKLKAVWVEELGLEPFSKTGATCPPTVNCANLLVPSDAFVQLNISPVAQ